MGESNLYSSNNSFMSKTSFVSALNKTISYFETNGATVLEMLDHSLFCTIESDRRIASATTMFIRF